MSVSHSRYFPIISIIGDFFILNLLFIAGFCFYKYGEPCFAPKYLLFYIYLNLAWLTMIFVFGATKIDRNTNKKSLFFTYIKIVIFFFFLFLLYFQITPLSYYPRQYIKFLFPAFFFAIVTWKFLVHYAFYLYRKRGFNLKTVIILGSTPGTKYLQDYFSTNQWHGYHFLGLFDDDADGERQVTGRWCDLKSFIAITHIDEIYIALHRIPPEIMPEITEIISQYPVKVRIIPDLGNFSYKSVELINYGSMPVIQVHQGPLSYWYNWLTKRVFDTIIALIMIVFVLSWMSAVLYLLSLLGSGEGLFFRQRRTCLDGKEFSCIKFKTMRNNPDADRKQATRDDQRITTVGKFLRKYSLDELPQFINVLLGQMSVVGPRPHMLAHTEQYRKLISRFMLRHTVKPGITGLAQVNGYRGEIKNFQDISNRVTHDVQYIENWSFNLDIKIIFLTIWVCIRGQKEAY